MNSTTATDRFPVNSNQESSSLKNIDSNIGGDGSEKSYSEFHRLMNNSLNLNNAKANIISNSSKENSSNVKRSVDEVDFVHSNSSAIKSNNLKNTTTATGNFNTLINRNSLNKDLTNKLNLFSSHTCLARKLAPGTLYGDCEVKTSIKSSLSTIEKFSIFKLNYRKKSDPNPPTGTTAAAGVVSKKDRHKFVKSASLARLLGNTYNTKKMENEMKINSSSSEKNASLINSNNINNNNSSSSNNSNNNITTSSSSSGGATDNSNKPIRRFSNMERFQKCTNLEDALNEVCLQDFREDKDLSAKALRTISRSLGKLWWKRSHSIDISQPDPEYKVSYLGNVLTGWAKGEGCVEKPLNTLWRNYTQNHKPDVIMRIKVCASGLKATTRQHGLTEYWANRITYCCAPKNYPRVFCWIYRHEGRKLKHELRCHAVLCSKESIAQQICTTLKENLDRALRDFKREKLSKQNARLSLANSVYENPSLPKRKIMLSVGGNNYRPPLERSKSAPKLMAIEEAIMEEDGEIEDTNEPEMPSCCQKASYYPAMTLGRRKCRRGHSIRRTGKCTLKGNNNSIEENESENIDTKESSSHSGTEFHHCCNPHITNISKNCNEGSNYKRMNNTLEQTKVRENTTIMEEEEDDKDDQQYMRTKYSVEPQNRDSLQSMSSLNSDDDDLEILLRCNNYDIDSPLAGEFLSYLDMKMKPKTASLTDLHQNQHFQVQTNYDNSNDGNFIEENSFYDSSITSDPKPRPILTSLSLDNLDKCNDSDNISNICLREDGRGDEEYVDDGDYDEDLLLDDNDDVFFQQSTILNLLHRNSLRKMANLSISSNEDSNLDGCIKRQESNNCTINSSGILSLSKQHQQQDSDEGSISSGCETSSTVTTNMDDTSLKYCSSSQQSQQSSPDDEYKFIRNDLIMLNRNQRELNHNDSNSNSNSNNNDKNERNFSGNQELKFSNAKVHFKLPRSEQPNITRIKEKLFSNSRIANKVDNGDVSDSEFSDESGYVEFQEQNSLNASNPRSKTISV